MSVETTVEVSETRSKIDCNPQDVRHITKVVSRQEWADVSENGIYGGKVYRLTDIWVGTSEGERHVLLRSSSEPWK